MLTHRFRLIFARVIAGRRALQSLLVFRLHHRPSTRLSIVQVRSHALERQPLPKQTRIELLQTKSSKVGLRAMCGAVLETVANPIEHQFDDREPLLIDVKTVIVRPSPSGAVHAVLSLPH